MARCVYRCMRSCLNTYLTGNKFVGMADYPTESVHDLLTMESALGSSSGSNDGRDHPSWVCNMEGYLEDM